LHSGKKRKKRVELIFLIPYLYMTNTRTAKTDMTKRDKIKAYAAWGAVCLFWGTTYLAIRIGVEVLPPALFAGVRFVVAGTFFLPVLLLRGHKLPAAGDLIPIAIVGIALLTIANGTVVWAEQWVPSSLAALIVATLPFWMVGMEGLLPRGDKLTAAKFFGILTGFAGLVLLLWPDLRENLAADYLKGVLAMFIPPIAWSAGSIYSKYHKLSASPLMAAACQMLIAGAILVIIGIANGEAERFTFSVQGIGAIAYLTVFGSILGYGSYIYALDKLPASVVSTYAFINPLVAVVLGWLILDERLDWWVAAATMMILSGVLMVKNSSSGKRTDTCEAGNAASPPAVLKQGR